MIHHVSADELKKWIEGKKKINILDCSDPEICTLERIKGAVCLPLNRVEEAKSMFERTLPVVVYCSDYQCNSSLFVAQKLVEFGFNEVYELGGGLDEWKREVFPRETHTVSSMEADLGGI